MILENKRNCFHISPCACEVFHELPKQGITRLVGTNSIHAFGCGRRWKIKNPLIDPRVYKKSKPSDQKDGLEGGPAVEWSECMHISMIKIQGQWKLGYGCLDWLLGCPGWVPQACPILTMHTYTWQIDNFIKRPSLGVIQLTLIIWHPPNYLQLEM